MMNILFHVDEESRWATCMGNIYNTLNYFQAQGLAGTIEVVANAVAVKALSRSATEAADFHAELAKYMKQGVQVVVCANAIKGNGIAEADLLPGVQVVPAGIIELAEKQNQGFAYIRP